MLKFFLDKFRESPGPLKQARLVIGDVIEEFADLAGHYLGRRRSESEPQEPTAEATVTSPEPAPAPVAPEPVPAAPKPKKSGGTQKKKAAPKAAAKKRAARTPEAPPRTVEVSPELEKALAQPANQKKQEFKVLAILWDAHHRKLGALSAKELSAHGTQLGLVIRHENVRKVIRMQLSDAVESVQNRADGTSIFHYRITPAGLTQFEEKYLK